MSRKFEFVSRLTNKEECQLPKRSTKKSAGYDFFNPEDIIIPPYQLGDNPTLVPTGIKADMMENEWLMLVNRSSNPKKKKLVIPNSIGVIDADYYNNPDNEGEIMFAFYNVSKEPVTITQGEKLGQGIFMKFCITDNDNAEGERAGGFGSTDKPNNTPEMKTAVSNKDMSELDMKEITERLADKFNMSSDTLLKSIADNVSKSIGNKGAL